MIPRLLRFALYLLTGSLWRWPKGFLRWIMATPARIWASLAILALLLAGWQSRRADAWQREAANTAQTLTRERKAAQAATVAAQDKSKKDAHYGQTNHDTLAAGGSARFADYAAAGHSLHENAPHRAPAAKADHPGLPENPTPDAIMAEISRVWITRSDWLTCDADWAYAQGGYDWAQRISE